MLVGAVGIEIASLNSKPADPRRYRPLRFPIVVNCCQARSLQHRFAGTTCGRAAHELELAASAVTALRHLVLQPLQPAGTAKRSVSHTRLHELWVGSLVGLWVENFIVRGPGRFRQRSPLAALPFFANWN